MSIFTFGCGALGELGIGRADDTRRPQATQVVFPETANRNEAGQVEIDAIALGTDHSLAAGRGQVFRWGLLGAHAVPRPWKGSSSGGGTSPSPEVVPAATEVLGPGAHPSSRASEDNVEEEDKKSQSSSSSDWYVCSVTCGGSNSYMLTSAGEVFMLGGLWPPGGDCDHVRHLWGASQGGPPSRVAKIAAGWRHCLLLTEAGCVFALGDDEHGQCAGINNGVAALSMPTQVQLVGVAAGACHSVAWNVVGEVFSWGHGGAGRLGLGSSQHRRTPTRIETLPEAVHSVGCGANFTLLILNAGRSLWACGGNQYGQLGMGVAGREAHEMPMRISFPINGEQIVDLRCGANHTLCITKPLGTNNRPYVWAWGCSSSGQCGRVEGEVNRTSLPQLRSAPERLVDFLPPSPLWPLAVAAGRSHSAVVASVGPRMATIPLSLELAGNPLGPPLPPALPPALPPTPHPTPPAASPQASNTETGLDNNLEALSTQQGSAPEKTNDRNSSVAGNTVGKDDDIIDDFLVGLFAIDEASPAKDSSVSPMPRQGTHGQGQSPSATAMLLELGEAALRGEDVNATTPEGALKNSVASTGNLLSTTGGDTRPGQKRGKRFAAASIFEPGSRYSKASTPRRREGKQGAGPWPRPPPSWSANSATRRQPHTQRRGMHEEQESFGAPLPHASPNSPPSQHSPRSPAQEVPKWTATLKAAPLTAQAQIPTNMTATPVPEQNAQPDICSTVLESLKGLNSIIAGIGHVGTTDSPHHNIPPLHGTSGLGPTPLAFQTLNQPGASSEFLHTSSHMAGHFHSSNWEATAAETSRPNSADFAQGAAPPPGKQWGQTHASAAPHALWPHQPHPVQAQLPQPEALVPQLLQPHPLQPQLSHSQANNPVVSKSKISRASRNSSPASPSGVLDEGSQESSVVDSENSVTEIDFEPGSGSSSNTPRHRKPKGTRSARDGRARRHKKEKVPKNLHSATEMLVSQVPLIQTPNDAPLLQQTPQVDSLASMCATAQPFQPQHDINTIPTPGPPVNDAQPASTASSPLPLPTTETRTQVEDSESDSDHVQRPVLEQASSSQPSAADTIQPQACATADISKLPDQVFRKSGGGSGSNSSSSSRNTSSSKNHRKDDSDSDTSPHIAKSSTAGVGQPHQVELSEGLWAPRAQDSDDSSEGDSPVSLPALGVGEPKGSSMALMAAETLAHSVSSQPQSVPQFRGPMITGHQVSNQPASDSSSDDDIVPASNLGKGVSTISQTGQAMSDCDDSSDDNIVPATAARLPAAPALSAVSAVSAVLASKDSDGTQSSQLSGDSDDDVDALLAGLSDGGSDKDDV